jgi:hypothetical protein
MIRPAGGNRAGTQEATMHFRWWNSFTLLAVILFAIGVIGKIAGDRMVFDPGRTASGKEWILYLAASVLMLINGLLTAPGNGRDEEKPGDDRSV